MTYQLLGPIFKWRLSADLDEIDKIVDNLVGDGEIDHPVHEMEWEEGDGEHDPAVFVDIAGLNIWN